MKKVLYIDIDGVLVDFQTGIDQLDDEVIMKFEGRLVRTRLPLSPAMKIHTDIDRLLRHIVPQWSIKSVVRFRIVVNFRVFRHLSVRPHVVT